MIAPDPTQRFTSRVENYRRFRPDYPIAVLELLRRECNLQSDSIVADVAFGTGIFTRLLLESGSRVIGVEPNLEMRRAGEEFLAGYPRFTSVSGTAEATTLPDHSVNIVAAAQAAHWFRAEAARLEFSRVVAPGGWVALIWNLRRVDASAFGVEYERLLLKFSVDYLAVRHDRKEIEIAETLIPGYQVRIFPWSVDLDCVQIEGRLLSSSYMPKQDDSRIEPMLRTLRRMFDAHQIGGRVRVDYDTRVYFAQPR